MTPPCPVGVHYDAGYERHDTGTGHPESAERYRTLTKALVSLPDEFLRLPGRRASVQEILLAHEHYYRDLVYRDVETLSDCLRTGDTAICEESYDVALEATGAVLNAVDAVMCKDASRVFCAVRPPGHHASSARGMGFCIFNHIAVAARYLQSHHGLRRIAIVDWDVHHGNGTEAIFLEDPDVLYISLHEQGLYPFTGPASEHGQGAGFGATLNLPLPAGTNGDVALAAWDEFATPVIESFAPEFILVSAGFDAHVGDPLGGLCWTDETFEKLTSRCVSLANRHCQGRLVSSLEGGYEPSSLAAAAVAHVLALRD